MDFGPPHRHMGPPLICAGRREQGMRDTFRIPDILRILQPSFYKPDRLSAASAPSSQPSALAGRIRAKRSPFKSRAACVVHVRVCTCELTQECGFILYPPSVASFFFFFSLFLLRHFPRVPFKPPV